jgi:tetratricopeptide (TPR) repeat protein
VVHDLPEAAQLVQRAIQAVNSRDLNAARDALNQAERLNPEQTSLWWAKANLYSAQGQKDRALEAIEKEVEYHPGNSGVHMALAWYQEANGHQEDAIGTLRNLLQTSPGNTQAVDQLSRLLFNLKRYREAIEPLRIALKADAENIRTRTLFIHALVRGGEKSEGLAELAKARERKLDASTLNSLAWTLAETNTEPALAKEMADLAIADYEERLKSATISGANSEHFTTVNSLGATWDTAGWAAFQTGNLVAAEKYVRAAWMLQQYAGVADHLGQIYERQGKKAEAIRAYQLALAAKSDLPETRERLAKLGGKPDNRPNLRRGNPADPAPVDAMEELSRLRSIPLPELTYKRGSADFFVLFSPSTVEDAQYIRGDEELKGAVTALRKATYNMPFPDQGPEKIVRRGILSCSEYTKPACTFVLLLPSNTTN